MALRLNKTGLDLIKKFEGCRLQAYQDVSGIWTVGWGQTGPWIDESTMLSQAQADTLLERELKKKEEAMSRIVIAPTTENEWAALVSLAYNIGIGAFANSTLLRYLNSDQKGLVPEQFLVWCKVKKKVIPSLLARRQTEKELYETK